MQPDTFNQQIPPTPAPYTPKGGFNWKQLIYFVTVGVVAAGLSGVLVWGYMSNQNDNNTKTLRSQITTKDKIITGLQNKTTATSTTSSNTMTSDQIFQEVSNQFGLKRSSLRFFKIWGQDRVSYPTGNSVVWAYKLSGTWHVALQGNGFPSCSQLSNIPEVYRPMCTVARDTSHPDDTEFAYMNSAFDFANYPDATAIKYINQ